MRIVAPLFVVLLACGPTASPSIDGGGGGADADPNAPDAGIDALYYDANDVCAELDFNIELLPPHLMILLDKSGSMTDSLSSGGTKWSQAQPAIEHLITTYQNQILFGFDAFPSSGLCDVDDPIVLDIATDFTGNPAVTSAMWATSANGESTPLYCGLNILSDAAYAPRLNDPSATKFVVVVSDGADLCGEGCCVPWPDPIFPPPECVAESSEFSALSSDLNSNHGIRTFVIGFDDPGGENVSEDQLNAIAANGGTPFTTFLLASNQTQLEAAFDEIAAEVVSCTYVLEDPGDEADPDDLNVYFDGEAVGYDAGCLNGAGWDWTDASHTSIIFCPDACGSLQAMEVDAISITFGCPSIIVD